jgi:SAM-dependent methyltransferase
MEIIYDNSKNLEKHSMAVKIIRILGVPLINNLPSSWLQKTMKKTSQDAKAVVEHGGSTHALEGMYTRHHRKLFSRGIMQGVADLFWHHCVSQPKALRNRLKIVEKTLEGEILRVINHKEQNIISILNVGGGSSRAIIHSIDKLFKKGIRHNVEVINIDKSQKAIDLGKEIAKKFNLRHVFKWICDDARNIKNHIPNTTIDIAEMVGLLDYFSREKGVEVVGQIYNSLENNGLLIIANIHPNPEIKFVKNTGWPHMYYRTPKALNKIIIEAGFKESTIILEPLGCHIIAIARK